MFTMIAIKKQQQQQQQKQSYISSMTDTIFLICSFFRCWYQLTSLEDDWPEKDCDMELTQQLFLAKYFGE